MVIASGAIKPSTFVSRNIKFIETIDGFVGINPIFQKIVNLSVAIYTQITKVFYGAVVPILINVVNLKPLFAIRKKTTNFTLLSQFSFGKKFVAPSLVLRTIFMVRNTFNRVLTKLGAKRTFFSFTGKSVVGFKTKLTYLFNFRFSTRYSKTCLRAIFGTFSRKGFIANNTVHNFPLVRENYNQEKQ